MSDKRRQMRIQGCWAPKQTKAGTSRKDKSDDQKPDGGQKCETVAPYAFPSTTEFVFKPTVKKKKEKPDVKIIDESGEFEISNGPHGLSEIQFLKGFIEPDETEWLMEQLLTEVPWEEREILIFGARFRKENVFWWSPTLNILREKIEQGTGLRFNSMLANLYRDNKDSVDWHSDDEKCLGENPIIASLSFGDTRVFELKKKPAQKEEDNDGLQKIKIPLANGSLLIMKGATQHDWVHRVGKEYHDRGPRINLTFRNIQQK